MMRFIEKVEQELFQKTKANWEAQLLEFEGNVSEPYYASALEYYERHINGEVERGDGDGCLAAVVDVEGHAKALFVVNHTRPKSDSPHLKMMDLHVEPQLNVADREPNYPQLAAIAAHAIIGCLGMTYDKYPSNELKIFTAIPLDKEFALSVMAVMFSKDGLEEKFSVSSHGNWIVVRKK